MSHLAPGTVIAGKFRLERVIGRGGMGSVWAARHEQIGMPVAVKFIEASADTPESRARFEREAKAAGQLRSPHVVQILDHGVDGDTPYIAMELLEGEDLGARLRRVGRISIAEMTAILTPIAKAIRRAHESGIVHRDLKPSNIFLARFDDDEIAKILDFGVAKYRTGELDPTQNLTQVGVVFGSPAYLSPEQARGMRVVDHRTDLWSLGVIVFRSLVGRKPFEAGTIGDLVVKLCIDPAPVPSAWAPDLPKEVDRFFERAFARDITKRFQTAVEMAQALEDVAASQREVVTARPPAQAGTVTEPLPPMIAKSAPAPQDLAPPAAPPSGTGPHSAFVPGTLTPPSGAFGDAAPGHAAPIIVAAPIVTPPIVTAPIVAPAPVPVVAPAPQPHAIAIEHARPPQNRAPFAAIAVLSGVLIALVIGIVGIVKSSGSKPGASDAAASPPSAEPTSPVVATAAPTPAPTPIDAPSAPASASAAPPDPSAPGSAGSSPGQAPSPAKGKPGKKRPNFGY